MHDPLSHLPGYALRRAANAMLSELSERLAAVDLRFTDASCLILIDANEGITASALGRALDIQRANMVPLLNRLEGARLIARTPLDGKSQSLSLSDEGKKRLAHARKIIDAFETYLVERVPAEHRKHLLPALNALW